MTGVLQSMKSKIVWPVYRILQCPLLKVILKRSECNTFFTMWTTAWDIPAWQLFIGTMQLCSRLCCNWGLWTAYALTQTEWIFFMWQWRSLYYRHACRACGKVGEFFVRKTLNGNFQFLLCGGCIRLPDVRDRLVQYSIDLYSVTGKLLVPSINMTRHTS